MFSSPCELTCSTYTRKSIHFQNLTSSLKKLPSSSPPITHIFPPTIEAAAPLKGLGREERAVQADAPGKKVITEDRKLDPLRPPAMINACKNVSIGGRRSHLDGRKSSAGVVPPGFWQLRKFLSEIILIVPAIM